MLVEVDEVAVQIYGDMALAKTVTRIEASPLSGRFRHLRVFMKRDGRWQIVVTQMTKVAEQ